MEIIDSTTIGEIVATDYRTAAVFDKYDIDFCCNGNRSIADACLQLNMDAELVKNDINSVTELTGNIVEKTNDYKSWPLEFLTFYIQRKHHKYVENQIPVLKGYLNKISQVHGKRHPELFEIRELFFDCANELTVHMKKEELMLFPYIRKMVSAYQDEPQSLAPSFGTIQNPISVMMNEHDLEGDRFKRIRKISGGYTLPDDACNTYKVTYGLLQEFEADLHLHIHLENNILFPKSIELETALAQ